MELSCHRMLPQQDETENGLNFWTLKRQTNTASNGVTIQNIVIIRELEYACLLRYFCHCRVGLRSVEGTGFIQLERC